MSEADRKAAYAWVADAIAREWSHQGKVPVGVDIELRRIEAAMRAAAEVPLSPERAEPIPVCKCGHEASRHVGQGGSCAEWVEVNAPREDESSMMCLCAKFTERTL